VLAAADAADAVREGPYGSAWFAHGDAAGTVTHGARYALPAWTEASRDFPSCQMACVRGSPLGIAARRFLAELQGLSPATPVRAKRRPSRRRVLRWRRLQPTFRGLGTLSRSIVAAGEKC
jgi:hypothetical protein